MKEIMELYVILIAIYFVNLTNITLFNAEWNGIAMWLSTGLFIAGTAYYLMSRESIKKNSDYYNRGDNRTRTVPKWDQLNK